MIGTAKQRRDAWERGYEQALNADVSRGLLSAFSEAQGRELFKKAHARGWAKGRMAACLG